MKTKKVIVTGANGYVGSHIADYFRNKGFIVYEMGRHKSAATERFFIPFTLGQEVDEAVLKGFNVLIHAAYDFKLTDFKHSKRINIDGSIKLLKAARKAGVKKIIFISSFASFAGAKSTYGLSKFAIEREAAGLGIAIVRPGIVFSKNAGSVIGSLKKLVRSLGVIPYLAFAKESLYLCHADDLAALVLKIANQSIKSTKPIIAANEKKFTLKEIMKIVAKANRKKALFVPVPYAFLFLAIKGAEMLGLRTGFRSDSLVGLANRNPSIDFSETRKIGMRFREFNSKTAVE